MPGVPNTFANASGSIPLSQLDANFNTTLTIGTTSVGLGNTISTISNVAISTGSVNGSPVGNVTPSSGAFTTLSATGNVTVADGTVSVPAIAFTSDTDSGVYRIGANNIGVGVNGAKVLDIGTTGLGVTGNITNANQVITASNASTALEINHSGSGQQGLNLNLTNASYAGTAFYINTTRAANSAFDLVSVQTNGTNRFRVSGTGYVIAGANPVSSVSFHQFITEVANGNTAFAIVSTNTNKYTMVAYAVDTEGYSGALAASVWGYNSTTGRSINAGGTINASGADYAEYETKNASCGPVAKGQIIGFDVFGKVTDKWAEAKSFGVKSTNPAYVGGDAWGSQEALGKLVPVKPVEPKPLSDAEEITPEQRTQYAADLAAYELAKERFDAALEESRAKVDRIAYSGKVPVNVSGAKVGDYIIPVQDGDGIGGIAVTEPTFEQYRKAVGQVRRLLPDGRPEIAVKVG